MFGCVLQQVMPRPAWPHILRLQVTGALKFASGHPQPTLRIRIHIIQGCVAQPVPRLV
jgi:predicted component of type VI protein secretion system